MKKPKKGSLIVFEGIDASGKTTQYQLFIDHLKKNKIPYQTIDFPQYDLTFFGRVTKRFLKGEFGSLKKVSPYLASVLYAMDRFSAKKKMEGWLKKGFIIVANRYAGSNMAHQGSKISNQVERKKLLDYLNELEFKVNKIPRPNLNVFLDVPPTVTAALMAKSGRHDDIADSDLKHQRATYRVYRSIARGRNWLRVPCVDEKGDIQAPDTIAEWIVKTMKSKGHLP